MATEQEQQELIDVLKFIPTKVSLSISGYGGETYAGKVSKEIYEFFEKNEYDIEEYASDSDDEWNDRVPEDLQPFPPGFPYECDNLWHESGAEMSDATYITVSDIDTWEPIWESSTDSSTLNDAGVIVTESSNIELDELPYDDIVFWGGQGEKGVFFEAEFTLTAPFDPKKLEISYDSCDGWDIITGVTYNGEELQGYDGYSTSGKWEENKWILINGDEPYEPVPIEDREEEDE